MMPKRTSAADAQTRSVRVVIVTLDNHLAGTVERVRPALAREFPGLSLSLHAASDWDADPASLERTRAAVAEGDIILCTMMFMDAHIQAILPMLQARRASCDALIGAMSAGEVIKLTRLGKFTMDGGDKGPMALLKRLRGSGKSSTRGGTAGAKQLAMLRRIPQILRFIPGTAQDVRAYFLTLQYWLAGSEANIANLVRFLVLRYSSAYAGTKPAAKIATPTDYPDVGLYHPDLAERMTERLDRLPKPARASGGTVGLLLMRSYVLAGNTAHYDGVIRSLEARGLRVIPAFAGGLDARPAVERYFIEAGVTRIDALLSLTGFSLVGGPAYNDSKAAEDLLARLDVPCVSAMASEFQSLEQWEGSAQGVTPVEATMMVAIPEIDGSTGPLVFAGRSDNGADATARDMRPHLERVGMLAARIDKLVRLRRSARRDRRIAIVLFNFPPNAGNAGTAAFLSVFASLHNVLTAMAAAGYMVDVPETADALRTRIIEGNAARHGAIANVHARVATDDHVRRERWLKEIEAQWGPAPGRLQTDGASLFVLGERFGNVFVGLQPSMGYEGDPMRLLFERGFAPTHAFAAFYRYLRETFAAHAVLHFGTHGALEFMPGKQVGLTASCWPDRLIGDLPNLYLYASNNPSEGTIAKRRAAATLVSHLTPPVTRSGLYKGLADLKALIDRWRSLDPAREAERDRLAATIRAQAIELELTTAALPTDIPEIAEALSEVEHALIPHGLHVLGQTPTREARRDLLAAIADASAQEPVDVDAVLDATDAGAPPPDGLARLGEIDRLLCEDHEIPGLIAALDGRYIRPAPGGDLLRTPEVLPTGRNIHGFDPFRIPSSFALAEGARHVDLLLERHATEGNPLPETVALVLWGTDNLKTEGAPIGQALSLMGAAPRFDSYGRLSGAVLIPLETLGRPRIDVVMTLSGIFRDLLPLQTRLLAEAAFLAATADEPVEQNLVRKHALAYAAAHACDVETAALRVFSNADGAYGSNVNMLIDSGAWDEDDEIAEVYSRRKSFAYGRSGKPTAQAELLGHVLGHVDLAYQNLDSVELGVTTVDHYFDTLGGISRAVVRAKGTSVPVYIGDQTRGTAKVRTLSEQVALETRSRALNPKWYEAMLVHGYEGVRQIEAHVTNTMGWSATTGQVAPWVYQELSETFVLDPDMRARLAALNPTASAKVAHRLLEAQERRYWTPDAATLDALRRAGDELEDRIEGIGVEAAA